MSVTLDSLLEYLPWLKDPEVEDVSIQEPYVVWVYKGGKFTRHEAPELDRDTIDDIAIVAGYQRRRDFDHNHPILGVDLIGREGRLHAVCEPHVDGCTNLCIRRGSDEWPTMESLVEQGMFRAVRRSKEPRKLTDVDRELARLYTANEIADFLNLAAANQRTIIIAGVNGAGKTYISKALIGKVPLHRRLIIIENARELRGVPHSNKVCLYYNREDATGITPVELAITALRMRTEQIFLQEIRDGAETQAFMFAGETGHRGAITTIHAGSCGEVIRRLKSAVRMTEAGRGWPDADIMYTLRSTIDVIIHVTNEDGTGRLVDEVVYYPPLETETDQSGALLGHC
jgi:type IV secretion system protein VirB11